ncbi:uncharacterized protein DUF4252 [Tenacibaculum adriaticum]|uniref:Uncharacterized protein DUF4252 n=1 Tax=Tenacibaculum adriaticum TaxID=413713 RepID=A0A5S5DWG8_9FLAO|nr:DUF4252 domain-containing protein [Tenacibaculum adriaticum]TYP99618.1 uncharacterized protein DUF4252 [Tenacibaculum adriaticum]
MKRLTSIFFAFFIVVTVNAQTAFKEFYKANENKTAFSINLSSSFGSSFFDDEDADEFQKLIKKSSDFKLLVFNNENNSVANDFKKFKRKNNLKTLVRVKDKESKAEIFFIEKDNFVREIIVQASSDDDKLVLFGLQTKLTKDELASIMSSAQEKVASK